MISAVGKSAGIGLISDRILKVLDFMPYFMGCAWLGINSVNTSVPSAKHQSLFRGNSETHVIDWLLKIHCKIAEEAPPVISVSSVARSGKVVAQPCLGVAVLKRELQHLRGRRFCKALFRDGTKRRLRG